MLTREQAIAALVEKDVAKWGESERSASTATHGKLTHGLAINKLAHYDIDNIDAGLAAEAKRVMTPADRKELRNGA